MFWSAGSWAGSCMPFSARSRWQPIDHFSAGILCFPRISDPKNPLYHALELRFPGFMHMAVPSDTRTLSWNPLTRGLRCLRDKADWIGAIEFTTAGGWSSTPIRGTSYCDNPLTGAPYLRPGPRRWVRRQERQPLDRRPAR